MTTVASIGGMTESERMVAWLGILIIAGFIIWSLVRWLLEGPVKPDPWDGQVSVPDTDEGPQICHRCLEEHDASAQLCRHCGAMVGPCTSFIPPLYLYSLGPALVAGTQASRRSLMVTLAFFVVSFAAFVAVAPLFFLVPVYWFKLLKSHPNPAPVSDDSPQAGS